MTMDRFILDTSLFTNPAVYSQFGPTVQEAVMGFVLAAGPVRAQFLMPLSVYREFAMMKDLGAAAADFESVVSLRSPRKFDLRIPGELLYELIEEVRQRIDRGLKIAEEAAKAALASGDDKGELINKLRGRYREALRQGILDSKEDVDVLLLAYELDGILVSADEGMRKWADKVGITIADPNHFRRILENLARGRATPGDHMRGATTSSDID
jgi:RNA ligase partner protein